MFKALFLATLFITLVVNIIFLLATKDKPPDAPLASSSSPTFAESVQIGIEATRGQLEQRRLFLRSNDFYDYTVEPTLSSPSPPEASTPKPKEDYLVQTTKTDLRVASIGSPLSLNFNSSDSSNFIQDLIKIQNETFLKKFDNTEAKVTTLKIRVKSSRNHVQVSVDDIVIYESKSSPLLLKANGDDETEQSRGLHVLVLNQFNGQVMAKRVFDTYSPGQDDELCFFLNQIQDGRLLVFAVKDEASFKMPLSSPARDLLEKLGSRHIMELRWRDMWAFVGRKWSPLETSRRLGESINNKRKHKTLPTNNNISSQANLAEGLTKSARFSDWAPPVVLETRVSLLSEKLVHENCNWSNESNEELNRRLDFCSTVEGYGRVCDCQSPAPISFGSAGLGQREKLANWQLEGVPVLVMASNRPYYLYRMLRSLLQVRGLNPKQVIVSIDGFYQEPKQVSQLFDLRYIQQRPRGRRSARISHHYKWSLGATFRQLFPEAQFALVFEEDLDIAQDALIYFNQTLELLRQDSSLYCVSAWNDQGYEHSAGDSQLLYRIETMPGLGWMLSRRLYLDELEPQWPGPEEAHDWDMWIRTEQIRRGRECIIPDVSRTFHFGSTGTNINSYFQRQYFSKHAFNLRPQSHFPQLHLMFRDPYERHLADLIRSARVLRLPSSSYSSSNASTAFEEQSDFLCSLANNKDFNNQALKKDSNTTLSNVIFIKMIDQRDYGNWLHLAKCWHIWDLDARGQHQSVWRLYLKGVHTLVVGAPASPHARLKPPDLVPFNLVQAS